MGRRKRKISKGAKHRLVVFGTISVIIIGYFLVSFSYYIYRIHSLNKEVNSLKTEYTNLQENEEELKTDIEKLQDPDYLARFARENYHYTKKDELVIQRNEQETKKEEPKKEKFSIESDVIIYISSGVLGAIILYVLIRKK